MGEQVKKFSLKRTSNTLAYKFTYGMIYPVYRNDMDCGRNMMFYIIDDRGQSCYFNTFKGKIETNSSDLDGKNWEVIRNNEEEKKMKFKAGDKIKFKNSWWDVTAGKEYELFKVDNSLKFSDDKGDPLNFYDLINECRTGIASVKKLIETKEEKKMQFKVGKSYKSNQSGAVYKYLGKNQGSTHLNFEIVSGGSVGKLTQFTIEYAELTLELQVEQGEEKAPDVPVFVKATLDEALTAFKEGNKSDFYMYNPKKGICSPLVNETNIRMLTTWTILKKVGE